MAKNDSLANEIDEFLVSAGHDIPEQEPITEDSTVEETEVVETLPEQKEDEVKEEETTREENVEEETSDTEEVETGEVEEEEVVQPTDDELAKYEELQKRYDEDTTRLRDALANLSSPQQMPPKSPGQKPIQSTVQETLDIDDETYNKMFEDKTVFVKILGDFVASASQKQVQDLMPVIERAVNIGAASSSKITQFFNENKDLVPYRRYVAYVSRQIESEHPEWAAEKELEEVEKRVRADLRLERTTTETKETKPTRKTVQRPSKPLGQTNSRARKESETLTSMEEEFAAILPDNFTPPSVKK